MKTLHAIALLFLTASTSLAQIGVPPPQISVSGSAEVKVIPDEVFVNVGIEIRDADLAKAKREHDLLMERALAYLKAEKIDAKDIQTDYINIQPTYERDSNSKPIAYIVRKSIEIRLADVKKLESLISGLLENGVNNVHGITLRTTELRKYRDQARAMAIRAAREKADALASELGVKCGKPYNINANEWGGWWNSGRYWGGSGHYAYQNTSFNGSVPATGNPADNGSSLSLGQISVSATVNVSFLLE